MTPLTPQQLDDLERLQAEAAQEHLGCACGAGFASHLSRKNSLVLLNALPALLAAARREARLADVLSRIVEEHTCEDADGNKKPDCDFDSGPYCAAHGTGLWGPEIEQARHLLAEDDQPTPEATDESGS